jgi:hypothetical protein
MKKYSTTLLLSGMVILLAGCTSTNTNPCFDEKFYRQHKDDVCTMDCPGVEGCDGKIYCNECEAARQGIHVKK